MGPPVDTLGEREAYLEKMDARMREWRGRLDIILARADRTQAEARQEYHKRVQEIHDKQEEMEELLNDLRQAGEETWRDVQEDIESTSSDIQDGIEEIRQKLA